MDPAFRQPPDLTDPAVCARECADLAAGMDQQAQALAVGSAMGAPPNQAFYFNKVAHTLKAAAALLTPAAPAAPPPGDVKPDAPADPPAAAQQPAKPKK